MSAIKTVIAFGTFDILHAGHLHYLEKAKSLGDKLIVVVARDENVLKEKGARPYLCEKDRLSLIKALKVVDKAVLGLSGDKFKVIAKYKPDIIALGYDQKVDYVALKKFLRDKKLKAKVVRISAYRPQRCKSSIIKRAMFEGKSKSKLELGTDII